MAPSKRVNSSQIALNIRTMSSQNISNDLVIHPNIISKRKNDNNDENHSENPIKRSRSAFTNITNATDANDANQHKICVNNETVNKQEINGFNQDGNEPVVPIRRPKMVTRAAARANASQKTAVLSNIALKDNNANDKNELHPDSLKNSSKDKVLSSSANIDSSDKAISSTTSVIKSLPFGVIDFDENLSNDPYEVSEYSMDIFEYLKEREKSYPIQYYMDKQPYITKSMRLLIIDWMAGVQHSFALHNESLYLAVKIIDTYLGQKVIHKNNLQLLGAVSLYIACKYEENIIPLIDDFTYICDYAYTASEIISMELDVFKTIKCDLGFPLSYNFLRRYARCACTSLPILTLARFVLEHSLMVYTTITFSDSKMASAAIFIALRMYGKPGWSPTLEYFSGYKLSDFVDIIIILNTGLHSKASHSVKHLLEKYSHQLKNETKVPLLSNEELLSDVQYLSIKERETIIKLANMKLSVDK